MHEPGPDPFDVAFPDGSSMPKRAAISGLRAGNAVGDQACLGDPKARMPALEDKMSADEVAAMTAFLVRRK